MKKLSWWKRRKLKKGVELEMLETLCTICLYLADESRHSSMFRGKYYGHFDSHFRKLKDYSYELRGIDNHTVTRFDFFE